MPFSLSSRVALLGFGVVGTLGAQAVPPAAVDLAITAKPLRGASSEVTAVAVRLELRGRFDASRPFSLRVPITYTGRTGIADRVDSLVVRDRSGPVPLVIEDDPVDPAGVWYFRHWRAQRAVRAPVSVAYRMRPNPVIVGGPQFEHWATGGGISSGGMQLFVIPESLARAALSVTWDLSDLPAGSVAASTYGEGSFQLVGSPDTLWNAFYLAGPAGRYLAPNSGFRAYWLGTPVYHPPTEMAFTHRAYEYLRTFFRDSTTTAYRVFLRFPGGGGGTAQQNSFMGGSAAGSGDSTRQGPRNTLTHEMAHYFVGQLSGSPIGGDPWFAEGLNTYYTRLLLLRSGLAPIADYESDINSNASRYYGSPFHNASADSLTRIGFATGFGAASAQNMAYTRGSLFWSDVDHRIRRASSGQRTLDDVFLPLFEARRRGSPLTQAAIVAAIERELGREGRDHFDAVIVRGETLVPHSDAFGPCFRRETTTLTVQGRDVRGYRWERVPLFPDEYCRHW
jgi:hypothetical protein